MNVRLREESARHEVVKIVPGNLDFKFQTGTEVRFLQAGLCF